MVSTEPPYPCHVGAGGSLSQCDWLPWTVVTSQPPPKSPDMVGWDICSLCVGVSHGENIQKQNSRLPCVPRLVSLMFFPVVLFLVLFHSHVLRGLNNEEQQICFACPSLLRCIGLQMRSKCDERGRFWTKVLPLRLVTLTPF